MSKHLISLNQVCAQVHQNYVMSDINWQIEPDQHWVLLGGNSSGKSALSHIILGQAEIISGERIAHTEQLACISFEQQQALIEAELKKDDADILDVIAEGTQVESILFEPNANQPLDIELADKLIKDFEFSHLLKRKFRDLSTGETRKLLLIKAFINRPALMVLDEPFDGLDAKSTQQLQQVLTELSTDISMVFILNRIDEIPGFITHYAYLKAGQLEFSFAKSDQAAYSQLMQLLHLQTTNLTIPPTDGPVSYDINPQQALVKLTQAKVVYDEKVIFEKLNWQIMPNQHWQLTGKNGSGKTCLLNLITGDNPQCYTNDIWLFGFQRGSGESIWQIKQHIGFISNQFHLNYRVGISALNTIISGFYDSIGLYNKPTPNQQKIASQWLELLALADKQDTPFNQLSFGDQRLLLIARAMVKHPPLLILDEPCIGLDEINRQRVLSLIEKICANGTTTVIYVNHHAQDKIQGINQFLAMEDYQPC